VQRTQRFSPRYVGRVLWTCWTQRPVPRRAGRAVARVSLCALCCLCVLDANQSQTPTVRIGVLSGGSHSVTELPLETYVARVLVGEAAPNTPPAALNALAIAVRTYTMANLGRHRAEGFDLCDQTHCQVMRTASADSEASAQATAGQVLLDAGIVATIYYSASCGGRSEIPSAVWPGAVDHEYLPSKDDDACGGWPAWSAELAAADLQRSLDAAGFSGRLTNVRIASRNGSGRVAELALDGVTPNRISGQDLRSVVGRTLGWQRILSAAFELRRIGDVYRFTGRGSGHGVGMCVIGSMHLAEAGQNAETILARYYPGLMIGPVPVRTTSAPVVPGRPTVAAAAPARLEATISLPEGDEGDREALALVAASAKNDLAAALGMGAPPQVTLRFHANTNDYERATGSAWFTSTAVVNGELHFLPLAVLRARGVLERTVRRALVQLMTAAALEGRPAWVREGIALYYADVVDPTFTSGAVPEVKVRPAAGCPRDSEFVKPSSAGALNDAYARARACFARQIASGRSWREVR
jgi:SpoIID/LytB domain protein